MDLCINTIIIFVTIILDEIILNVLYNFCFYILVQHHSEFIFFFSNFLHFLLFYITMDNNDEPELEVFHSHYSYPLVTTDITDDTNISQSESSLPTSSSVTATTVVVTDTTHSVFNNQEDDIDLPPLVSALPSNSDTININLSDNLAVTNIDEETARKEWDTLENPSSSTTATTQETNITLTINDSDNISPSALSSNSLYTAKSSDPLDIAYKPFKVPTTKPNNNSSLQPTKIVDEFDQEINQINNKTKSNITTNNNNDDGDEFDNEFTDDTNSIALSSSSNILSNVVLNVASTTIINNNTNSRTNNNNSTTNTSNTSLNVTKDTTDTTLPSSSYSVLDNIGDALRNLQSSLITEESVSSSTSSTITKDDNTTKTNTKPSEPSIPLVAPKAPLAAVTEDEDDEGEEDDEAEEETKVVQPPTISPIPATPLGNNTTIDEQVEHEELEEAFNTATAVHTSSANIYRSASPSSTSSSITLISFMDAATYMLSPDQINPYRKSIIITNPPDPNQSNHCFSWLSSLLDTPLREGCWYERDAIFSVAKMTYQANDNIHIRLMRTLYSLITGKDIQQPISSWIDIGFQRDGEFITDLRSGGMLGPLQMLYLINNYPWLIRLLSSAALSPIRGFPLMVTAINFTARTLQCLRSGKLNRPCNRAFEHVNHQQKQRKTILDNSTTTTGSSSASLILAPSVVSTVVNDLYCALLYNFIEEYEKRKATIQSIGLVMTEVTNQCLNFPERCIDNLRAEHRRQLSENSQPKVNIADGGKIDPMVGSKLNSTIVKSSPPSVRSLVTNKKSSSPIQQSSNNNIQRNFTEL